MKKLGKGRGKGLGTRLGSDNIDAGDHLFLKPSQLGAEGPGGPRIDDIGSVGCEEDEAWSSGSDHDADTHSTLSQSQTISEPDIIESPEVIKDAAKQIEGALADYNEMRVLLVGKSGVGKSSFVNCLLHVNKAPVGRVKPETNEVTEYTLNYTTTDGGDEVLIKVYDTPGFGAKKKENKKFVAEIQEKCEIVDVIFLCIRIDDQLRVEDKQTITLLAKEFDDKFWGKCLVVFTRANMVRRMGEHKSVSEKDYLRTVRDDLKEEIQKEFEKTKATLPPFVLAGAPEFEAEGRMIPNINDASSRAKDNIDWLPVVAEELFKSGCSDKAKVILLRCGWRKWAHISAGFSAGLAAGVAVGGGMVIAGAATLLLPPIGPIVLGIGGGVLIVSLASGGASVGAKAQASTSKLERDKQVKKVLRQMKRERRK